MVMLRWVGQEVDGYCLPEYFSSDYGEYYGADVYGVYPVLFRVTEDGVEEFGGPNPARTVPRWVIDYIMGREA